MSRATLFIALAVVLFGLKAWGNDYSHGQTIVARATAHEKEMAAAKDSAIIAAIEASSADATARDAQRQEAITKLVEVNRLLIERIDVLTTELARRSNGE